MVAGRPRLHYDGLMSHVRVFSIESLSAVHAFFRQVDHLFATLDGAREARGRGARIREVDEYHFRVLAGFTLQALPKAVEALRLEGGVIHDPADQWGEVTHPNLPEIGEPVFMEAKQRIAAYGHSGVAPGA